MRTLSFDAYREQEREWRKTQRRLAFVCCECGRKSKTKLAFAHPTKPGMVCKECRDKVWKGGD